MLPVWSLVKFLVRDNFNAKFIQKLKFVTCFLKMPILYKFKKSSSWKITTIAMISSEAYLGSCQTFLMEDVFENS